jgi:hypothetical protein
MARLLANGPIMSNKKQSVFYPTGVIPSRRFGGAYSISRVLVLPVPEEVADHYGRETGCQVGQLSIKSRAGQGRVKQGRG